jgi:hypothetical protein
VKKFTHKSLSALMAFLLAFGQPLAGCSRVTAEHYANVLGVRAGDSDSDSDSDSGTDDDSSSDGDDSPTFPEGNQTGVCTNCNGDTKEGDVIRTELPDGTYGVGNATRNESGGWDIGTLHYGCSGGACLDTNGRVWRESSDNSSEGGIRASIPSVDSYSPSENSADNGVGAPEPSGGNGSNRTRADRNNPSESKSYKSIDELEKEVFAERETLGTKAGALSNEVRGAADNLGKDIGAATDSHNAMVNNSLSVNPVAKVMLKGNNVPDLKTPRGTELGEALHSTKIAIQFVGDSFGGNANGEGDILANILERADDAAQKGDVPGAKKRIAAADAFINAGRFPQLIPTKPASFDTGNWDSPDAQRFAAYSSALSLAVSASELDKSGLPSMASALYDAAVPMLNIGLGLLRVASVVDLPSSLVEAFTGNVVEFGENGEPVLRSASVLERSFAIGTVFLAASGFAAGGWAAALGVGVVAGVGKAFEKQIAAKVGAEAAERAAKELLENGARVADSAGDAIAAMGSGKFREVLNLPKGKRPAPETYLPREYIEKHLAKFDEGASRFMRKVDLEDYGPAQIDGTSFILPKSEADKILSSAAGDKRAIEKSLGLDSGFLDKHELVRLDIPKPRELNIRLPSGNEAGANSNWLPGGKLPNGNSESVIDLASAPSGSWTSSSLNL